MQRPTVIEHPSTHWSDRAGALIQFIGLHHSAGTDSLDYLTSNPKQVSTHVLISKPGTIYRMVPDRLAANTVGYSNVGRYTTASGDRGNANQISLNVELENRGDGRDPYPDEQIAACGWQIAQWWREFGVLPLVPHRLIDTQGKTDPLGLDLARVYRAALAWFDQAPAPLPFAPYTEDSPILATPPGDVETFVAALLDRASGGNYDAKAVNEIARGYWAVATAAGVDPWLAAGQCMHETGWLTSFWSARPQRNPAGLGVTGEWRDGLPTNPAPGPDWAYNSQRRRWERGLSFPRWVPDPRYPQQIASIEAHIGRLLAYAVLPVNQTPTQAELVGKALTVRSLATMHWGMAPKVGGLGGRWARSKEYGGKVAAAANRLRGIV
ncbi:MAG TPA: peptidoglycan recognition family protein [Roseiflexaceae bacterium]|nr:peptidoglycan recognition family protein [Roseiflexaceae bacterium]